MLIVVYGCYRFKNHVIGCRRDFCNGCEKEVLTELWRAFRVGHLFWIPLLPLGWQQRWICGECGGEPRARYRSGRWAFWAGLVMFTLIAVLAWFMPIYDQESRQVVWGMRIIFPLAAAGMLVGILYRRPNDLLNTQRRQQVVPLPTDACPYCRQPLQQQPAPYCPTCRVQVYTE